MTEMDMGLAPKNSNNKKRKRKKKKQSLWDSIVTGLFPCKGDSSNEIIRKIVFLFALAVLVAAVMMIAAHFLQYAHLGEEAAVDSEGNTTAVNRYIVELRNQEPTTEKIDKMPQGTINETFASLYAENNDFIGWLTIPGTNIDYPVMQHPEKDYYLHRNFQKEDEFSGTLFIDHKGLITKDSMPQNTIIYGHNMLYRFQFSALSEYKKSLDFLKFSPTMEFDTLYRNSQYKIISVFLTNIYPEHGEVFEYTKKIYFKNSDEFFDFVLECEDRSMYETGVDVQYGDEFLTLSTCDASTSMDLRLVVVARRVRENESPEVDTEKFVRKDSIKYFDAYYDIFGWNLWQGRTWDTSVVKGLDDYIKSHGLEDDPKDYEEE